ncbi:MULTISPECIES: hypothetical protein [unclassified Streptomyces]|uniref:hypothetical protein n=1 Tax=unclassified Streptomyces TaxID=2593676 RepID=UPI0036EF5B91
MTDPTRLFDDAEREGLAELRAYLTGRPQPDSNTGSAAALRRVRAVLETEHVVGRTALEYRGLICAALFGDNTAAPTSDQTPAPGSIEVVYRVRCSGPCRRWLSIPEDYESGEDLPLAALEPMPTAARAGMWPDETAARRAAWAAGWSGGMCPDCGAAAEHAPRPEPHPTQADVDHAQAVLAEFEGRGTPK